MFPPTIEVDRCWNLELTDAATLAPVATELIENDRFDVAVAAVPFILRF